MVRSLKAVVIISLAVSLLCTFQTAEAKFADLAGKWYSPDSRQLKAELQGYISLAGTVDVPGEVIGAIVPHAGYRFSGPVAAYVYKAVQDKDPSLIVVVGFTHRKHYRGRISVFTDPYFETPIGKADTDKSVAESLIAFDDNIRSIPDTFDYENSIEMQVPFIQVAVPEARLVLVALADQRKETWSLLGKGLYDVLKGRDDFVILASTDMSHYLSYDDAVKKDTATAELIETFKEDIIYKNSLREGRPDNMFCGYGAVCAVIQASKALGANDVKILKYANSGDTSGDKSRVVGYLSAAFFKNATGSGNASGVYGGKPEKENEMFSEGQKKELLKIARETIKHYLDTGQVMELTVEDEALKQNMGAFVTLHKNGRLRGCIGHMVGTEPLDITVRDMAISAATRDPRFPPVTAGELGSLDIEISVLTPMKRIEDPEIIQMGKHGVMVKQGWASGVYLPQVADETGWDREQFMNSLCAQKAGIEPDAWKEGSCDIFVFTTEVFGEEEQKKE